MDAILLDDAFQHRKVKASKNILLTTYHNLYVNDYVLPVGNLRESKKGADRADIVVVTKCPDNITLTTTKEIRNDLNLRPEQKIYFSKITYDQLIYGITKKLPLSYLENKKFTLVTGIANSDPLVDFLTKKQFDFYHQKFSDHHHFSDSEVLSLKRSNIILTTEKDFVRLQPRLQNFPIYYLPINSTILLEQEAAFKKEISNSVAHFCLG